MQLGFFQNLWLNYLKIGNSVGSTMRKIMWKVSFMAFIWVILIEHNDRCFQGNISSVDALEDKVKFLEVS